MIRNQLELQKYILTTFFEDWKRIIQITDLELDENSGRCIEIQRRSFVMIMSVIEWQMKESINLSANDPLKECLNKSEYRRFFALLHRLCSECCEMF